MIYHKTCYICGKEFKTTRYQKLLCTVPHPKTCKKCGKTFYVTGTNKDQEYCSKECKRSDVPERACIICGKKFHPKNKNQKICDDEHYRECPVCHKKFKIGAGTVNKVCCSQKCRGTYEKENGAFRRASEKAKQTCLDRYGADSYSKTQNYRDQVRETSLKKFGVEHPGMSEEVKQHRRETMVRRYGVENAGQIESIQESKKKHQRETYLKKYGVDHPWKLKSIRGKSAQTMIRRYGTQYPLQNEELKKKAQDTSVQRFGSNNYRSSEYGKSRLRYIWLERYGVDNPFKSEEIKKRIRRTNIKKYGVPYPSQNEDICRKQVSSMSDTCLKRYGVPWPCMTANCVASHSNVSKLNLFYMESLEKLGFHVTYEKHIEDRSYDLHLNDYGVLIEIDPTCTHNSYWSPLGRHEGKDPYYQYDKTKLAESYGFRCIHVWDWDDWDKIVNILPCDTVTIGARKCSVVRVQSDEVYRFLNTYHLQGSCRAQKYRYGLIYDDELIGVMTFGVPRYNRKFEYELLRLCFKPDVTVLGGSEKLFKSFISEVHPSSVISYCDNSKFQGDVYKRLGMTLQDKGKPSKHWYSRKKSEKMQHITDNFLRQRGFDQIFGTNYGKGTSNEQLMLERGYLPVYDCGQSRYVWYCK